MSAIVLDDKIHLLGGRDVRSVGMRHEIYDPSTDKYTILGGMRGKSTGTQPFVGQRDHMGVAVVDGKIHAIAGRMDSTISIPGSMRFMISEDRRLDVPERRCPRHAQRPIMRLHQRQDRGVRRGEATGKVFGTNEAYDPKTDTWEQLTPMACPGVSGLAWRNVRSDRQQSIHVPGGGPSAGWPGAGCLSRRFYVRLNTVTAEIVRPPQGAATLFRNSTG